MFYEANIVVVLIIFCSWVKSSRATIYTNLYMKVLTYIIDFAPINKYLKVIVQCLESKIFKDKGDVLFVFFFILQSKTSTFS